MARFLPPETFGASSEGLTLLPFNFERTGTSQYLLANMVGDFVRLSEDEINKLVDLQLRPGDGLYERAYAAHLITGLDQNADSGDCGQAFRLIADTDSDRSRTAFR
jgi:hypothetical protein